MDSPSFGGYDLDEELYPMTYQHILSLLPDDKRTAPTRFELFRAKREFEEERSRRQIAREHTLEQVLQMGRVFSECTDLYCTEIIENFPKPKVNELKDLVLSRVMTRSMTTNVSKFICEVLIISSALCVRFEILVQVQKIIKVKKCANLGELLVIFTRDTNELKDRILAVNQLTDKMLRYMQV